jgi:hypothetical protein
MIKHLVGFLALSIIVVGVGILVAADSTGVKSDSASTADSAGVADSAKTADSSRTTTDSTRVPSRKPLPDSTTNALDSARNAIDSARGVIGSPQVKGDSPDTTVDTTTAVDTSAATADSTSADSAKAAEPVPKPEPPAHHYVGAKKCKICHKDVYDTWLLTTHATAYDRLSLEEKQDPDCVRCHSAGTTAKGVLLEGVQCESCHGPGADYRKTSIMRDKELALENGLIEPEAEVCESCHNEESPTFKGFDYEEDVKKTEFIHIYLPGKED